MSVDPVSLVAEGGVLAAIGGAISATFTATVTILSWIQSIAISIYILATIVTKTAYWFFSSIFTVVMATFQGATGNAVFLAEEFIDDNNHEFFVQKPILRERKEGSGIQAFFFEIGDKIAKIVSNLFVTAWALFTALPAILIIAVVIFVLSIIIIPFQPVIFVVLDRVYYFWCLYLNAIAYGLNQYEIFTQDIGPLINDAIDAFISIIRVIFSFVCAGPLTAITFAERCPIIDLTNTILNTTMGFFLEVIQKLWTLFITILIDLGNILCPDGLCARDFCLRITGFPTCFWTLENPELIFQFFYYLIFETLIGALYTFYLIYAFFSECCFIFVFAFGFIVRPFITKETFRLMNTFTRYLILVSSVKIPNVKSAEQLEGLKNFEVGVLNGIRVVSFGTSNTIGSVFSLTDSFYCNVFLGGRSCFIYKICTITPLVPRSLCDSAYDPARCSETCDFCYYKFFNRGAKTIIFDFAKERAIEAYQNSTRALPQDQWLPYIDDSGYFFSPCNLANNCCNPRYSLLSIFFTVLGSAP